MGVAEETAAGPAAWLRARLGGVAVPATLAWDEVARRDAGTYEERLLEYADDEGEATPAYLLLPKRRLLCAGIVVFHQHNSQWHLGKSEVAGHAGDPLQAFGPALARRGVAVLAPDAIGFEDRRVGTRGTVAAEDDWVQHYNQMAHRLLRGDLLMRKVVDDAMRAFTVLRGQEGVDPDRLGTLGHSFGGTTALYHAVLDGRPAFVGVSGAVCSFATRMRRGTSIGMVEAVPGLAKAWEMSDILATARRAGRGVLVVSASDDRFSRDADEVVAAARSRLGAQDAPPAIDHVRFVGDHPLTRERVDAIVEWVVRESGRP